MRDCVSGKNDQVPSFILEIGKEVSKKLHNGMNLETLKK